MADSNSSRSRGITTEDYPRHQWTRGTREALIQHGITLEGPFPGDPGEKKTTCKAIDPLGREISIRRNSKTTFSVFRYWSDDEKAIREQRQRRAEEIQAANALVASWPKSPREFRERASDWIERHLDFVAAHCTDGLPTAMPGYGGYRFDDATMARVYELSDELLRIVEAGGVVLDADLRKQQTPACIAGEVLAPDAAHADNPIQYGGNVVPFRRDSYTLRHEG